MGVLVKKLIALLPLMFCSCIWVSLSTKPIINEYGMLVGEEVKMSYYEANEETILRGLVDFAKEFKKLPELPPCPIPVTPVPPVVEPTEPGPSDPQQPGGGESENGDSEEPPPPGEPSLTDEVDLSTVQWMDGNLSDWEVVTPLEVVHQGIMLNYQHNANWANHPELQRRVGKGGQIAGNFHIGRWNGSRWQVCGWEWFRPGQHHCQKNIFTKEGHACHGMAVTPIQPGEDVLFMVSTGARVGLHSVDTRHQRSQLIKRKWK
jgi:hypothetical protein